MDSMAPANHLEERQILLDKLKIYESTINELLFDSVSGNLNLVKGKMMEMSELVDAIPGYLKMNILDWQKKLDKWWSQYVDLMDKAKQIALQSEGDLISRIEQHFTALPFVTSPNDIDAMRNLLVQISQSLKLIATHNRHEKYKESDYKSLFNFALEKLPFEMRAQFELSFGPISSSMARVCNLRNFIGKQMWKIYTRKNDCCGIEDTKSLNEIRIWMANEFEQLKPIEDANNVEQLKCLTNLIAKIRSNFFQYHDDEWVLFEQLMRDLFELSFVRLPFDLQQQYNSVKMDHRQFGAAPPPLIQLIRFLFRHIGQFHFQQNVTFAQHIQQVRAAVRECASAGADEAKYCNYCHTVGHTIGECEQIKTMLCTRCFKTGHKARHCKEAFVRRRRAIVICIECGQFGHTIQECPSACCFDCNQTGHMAKQCTAICKR